jgi:hypothetical protein
MSKQWQPTTRGGHDYRITISDPSSGRPIRGVVDDSGLTVEVHWTETGRCLADSEHQYDLIPVEPEAPSPAKARVDLALAAMRHKLASDAMDAAMERESEAEEQLREALKACEKDNALVSIHGELFLFQVDEEGCIFFEKIEVL